MEQVSVQVTPERGGIPMAACPPSMIDGYEHQKSTSLVCLFDVALGSQSRFATTERPLTRRCFVLSRVVSAAARLRV